MIWTPHVTVAAVAEQAGRFLLVEEHADGQLVINQPAGHLEAGEGLVDAVIRETREETGWRFLPHALLGVYRWPHPHKAVTFLRFAFIGEVADHDPIQPLDQGIERALWLSAAEIRRQADRHRSPQVLRCLEDYLAGQRYPLALLKDLGADGP